MDKSELYDDISGIIKERVDNFELNNDILEERLTTEAINKMLNDLTEFGMTASYITSINNGKGICIQSINPMDMRAVMLASICGLNHGVIVADDIELAKIKEPSSPINDVPFYPKRYASRDTKELIDAIIFQKEKQPKDNHPQGWYRKLEKKRY